MKMKISLYPLVLAVAGCAAPRGDLSVTPNSSSQESATSNASNPRSRQARAEPQPPSWYDEELSRLECMPGTPRQTGGETGSIISQLTVLCLNSARARAQFHKRTRVPENGYSILAGREGLDLIESMKRNSEIEVFPLAGMIVNKGESARFLSYTSSQGNSWSVRADDLAGGTGTVCFVAQGAKKEAGSGESGFQKWSVTDTVSLIPGQWYWPAPQKLIHRL